MHDARPPQWIERIGPACDKQRDGRGSGGENCRRELLIALVYVGRRLESESGGQWRGFRRGGRGHRRIDRLAAFSSSIEKAGLENRRIVRPHRRDGLFAGEAHAPEAAREGEGTLAPFRRRGVSLTAKERRRDAQKLV